MNPKKKIDMLSPEEMKQEQTNTTPNVGAWDPDIDPITGRWKNPEAACKSQQALDHCECIDETGWIHYGICKWDLNPPRAHLYCAEGGDDSGTIGGSGFLL